MEYKKTSENLYKWTERHHNSKFVFFCPTMWSSWAAKGLMGRNTLLKQCSTRSRPLRDISRQSPSCKLASCYAGLDIKICDFQKRESNVDMAVGTFLGTANLINPTGRKSHGIPVTSELDWDQDLDVHMWPDTNSDLLIHLPDQNPDPSPSAPTSWQGLKLSSQLHRL